MQPDFDLYEFPKGFVGRRTYVSVRGHARSIPALYTYKGLDGRNYVHPDYGGDWSGVECLSDLPTPMLMRDIGEYTSVLDGSRISSRSQHRDHMRQHGVVEVGNEKFPARTESMPVNVGKDIKKTIEQLKARA